MRSERLLVMLARRTSLFHDESNQSLLKSSRACARGPAVTTLYIEKVTVLVSEVRAERLTLSRNGSFGELQARGSEGCAVTMQHKMQCNGSALHCVALRRANFHFCHHMVAGIKSR